MQLLFSLPHCPSEVFSTHSFFFHSEDMLLFLGVTILLLLFTVTDIQSVSIGTIQQARIVTGAPSTWLQNQSSWSQCVCYALGHPSVVAFNSYPLNGSCQLFSNLSAFPFEVTGDPNVTVYLLQPLQRYTPCCSNLTWLLDQLKSETSSTFIPTVEGLALDADRNQLGVVSNTALQVVSADLIMPTYASTTPPYNARPHLISPGSLLRGNFSCCHSRCTSYLCGIEFDKSRNHQFHPRQSPTYCLAVQQHACLHSYTT